MMRWLAIGTKLQEQTEKHELLQPWSSRFVCGQKEKYQLLQKV